MPRRRKKKEPTFYGKTEDEWKEWGERFGKEMEKKEWRFEGKSWWYHHFGFVGPLIASIFGIIGIALAIIVLKLLNVVIGSTFIIAVANFLFTYLPLLFAISLFYGYNEYFSKRYWKNYWIISPLTTAVSVGIAIWIAVWVLNLLNTVPQSRTIASVANFLSVNLLTIVGIVLVAGYLIAFMNKWFMNIWRP